MHNTAALERANLNIPIQIIYVPMYSFSKFDLSLVRKTSYLPPGGKKAYLDFGRKLVFDIIFFRRDNLHLLITFARITNIARIVCNAIYALQSGCLFRLCTRQKSVSQPTEE